MARKTKAEKALDAQLDYWEATDAAQGAERDRRTSHLHPASSIPTAFADAANLVWRGNEYIWVQESTEFELGNLDLRAAFLAGWRARESVGLARNSTGS